ERLKLRPHGLGALGRPGEEFLVTLIRGGVADDEVAHVDRVAPGSRLEISPGISRFRIFRKCSSPCHGILPVERIVSGRFTARRVDCFGCGRSCTAPAFNYRLWRSEFLIHVKRRALVASLARQAMARPAACVWWLAETSASVWRAIISSSSVGITYTA